MANPVKIKVTVSSVIKHTDSVVSYKFTPQGRVPGFKPGQFLHLALDDYRPEVQWPESRVFSIASSPDIKRAELAIIVSVKGPFTERMYDTLEEGDECWLKLPYGEFFFPDDKPLVLIAGGVGVTPYLSLLNSMLENIERNQPAQDVHLYYGIRSPEYYLINDLLEKCEHTLPGFRKSIYCENSSTFDKCGYIDAGSVYMNAPKDALFYISGPLAMIMALKKDLLSLGIDASRIIIDDWE